MSGGAKGRSEDQARILTAINERYTTNRHRPCIVEEEGRWRHHNGEAGAEILEYVITVSRNNVLYICFRVNDRWRANG